MTSRKLLQLGLAALAALALPPVRRKLEIQCEKVRPGTIARPGALVERIKKLDTARASAVLDLIEQAEKDAGIPANTRSNGANPLSE